MAVNEDPDWPDAYANLGQSKLYTGAVAEGLASMERAVRLDPDDPLIGIWYARTGLAHLLLSQINEAVYCGSKGRGLSMPRCLISTRGSPRPRL